MNREIKFRAFNHRTKILLPVRDIFFLEGCLNVIDESKSIGDNVFWWPLDYCELMQFTGLHDSAGNEIFENDILKTKAWDGKEDIYWTIKPELIISCGCCSVVYGYDLDYDPKNSEIIGNLYEHAHLLESKE